MSTDPKLFCIVSTNEEWWDILYWIFVEKFLHAWLALDNIHCISILDSFSRKSTWNCSTDYSKDIDLSYESRSFMNLACLEDISVQLSPCNDKKVDFLKRKKSFRRFSYYRDEYKGGHFTPTSADDQVNSECKRSKKGSISWVQWTSQYM